MQLPEQLLAHARELANVDPNKPKQVNLRRAASAAYYALFHAVSDELARRFRSRLRPAAARLLEHGRAKNAAADISKTKKLNMIRGAPACPAHLVQAAADFVRLQETRHLADYSVDSTFRRPAVLTDIARAERSVKTLRDCRNTDEQHAFLLALLSTRTP